MLVLAMRVGGIAPDWTTTSLSIQPDSFLIVSAEIAVAFIGFASLVGVFASRGNGKLSLSAYISLRALLDYGLISLFASGLPLLLAMSALESTYLWPVASATSVAAWATYVILSRPYYREIAEELSRAPSLQTRVFLFGDAASMFLVFLNALGVVFEPNAVVYCAGAVAWRLAGAAFSFRSLIDEIWSKPSE